MFHLALPDREAIIHHSLTPRQARQVLEMADPISAQIAPNSHLTGCKWEGGVQDEVETSELHL